MGCGSTRSNSTTEIVQLRPFPIDSKSKLPNEALEGFGTILKLQGAPLKPKQDTRKKPGKFEPGSNVYSNVIKDSAIQPKIQLNPNLDSNRAYCHDIKLQEPAHKPKSQVDIQIPIHIQEQNSSQILDAYKAASKSQSSAQSRRMSVGEEVEKSPYNEERDVILEGNGSKIMVYNELLNDFQDPDVINYVESVIPVKLIGEPRDDNKQLTVEDQAEIDGDTPPVKLIGEPRDDNKQFTVENQAGIDGDIPPVNSEGDLSKLEIDPQQEIKRVEELRKQHAIEAQAYAARKNESLRQAELDALNSFAI